MLCVVCTNKFAALALSLRFWFEELRKRRIEELKQELERSEGSIGLVIFLHFD